MALCVSEEGIAFEKPGKFLNPGVRQIPHNVSEKYTWFELEV